jgi:hypothetical protein
MTTKVQSMHSQEEPNSRNNRSCLLKRHRSACANPNQHKTRCWPRQGKHCLITKANDMNAPTLDHQSTFCKQIAPTESTALLTLVPQRSRQFFKPDRGSDCLAFHQSIKLEGSFCPFQGHHPLQKLSEFRKGSKGHRYQTIKFLMQDASYASRKFATFDHNKQSQPNDNQSTVDAQPRGATKLKAA